MYLIAHLWFFEKCDFKISLQDITILTLKMLKWFRSDAFNPIILSLLFKFYISSFTKINKIITSPKYQSKRTIF